MGRGREEERREGKRDEGKGRGKKGEGRKARGKRREEGREKEWGRWGGKIGVKSLKMRGWGRKSTSLYTLDLQDAGFEICFF